MVTVSTNYHISTLLIPGGPVVGKPVSGRNAGCGFPAPDCRGKAEIIAMGVVFCIGAAPHLRANIEVEKQKTETRLIKNDLGLNHNDQYQKSARRRIRRRTSALRRHCGVRRD